MTDCKADKLYLSEEPPLKSVWKFAKRDLEIDQPDADSDTQIQQQTQGWRVDLPDADLRSWWMLSNWPLLCLPVWLLWSRRCAGTRCVGHPNRPSVYHSCIGKGSERNLTESYRQIIQVQHNCTLYINLWLIASVGNLMISNFNLELPIIAGENLVRVHY